MIPNGQTMYVLTVDGVRWILTPHLRWAPSSQGVYSYKILEQAFYNEETGEQKWFEVNTAEENEIDVPSAPISEAVLDSFSEVAKDVVLTYTQFGKDLPNGAED